MQQYAVKFLRASVTCAFKYNTTQYFQGDRRFVLAALTF